MAKLTKEQLIRLVERIQNGEGDTEAENDELIDVFMDNVPDPDAVNYIFELEHQDLTPAQIVDKALAYRPIQL